MNKSNCNKWRKTSTRNPLTNRPIKLYKKTFRKLSKECDKFLQCKKLKGLEGTNMSCYLDSVLFALFARPNKFIDKAILNKKLKKNPKNVCKKNSKTDLQIRKGIQRELNEVTHAFRLGENSINTCEKLRKIFAKCPKKSKTGGEEIDFSSGEQYEAAEFLQYLFTIFNVTGVKTHVITYFTNSLAQKPKLIKSSIRHNKLVDPIWFVDPFKLQRIPDNTKLKTLLTHTEDSGELDSSNLIRKGNQQFRRRIEINRVLSAPYLIFWIQRASVKNFNFNGSSSEESEWEYESEPESEWESEWESDDNNQIVIEKPVIPNQQIALPSKQVLKLSAIVIHYGRVAYGHYITLLRCRQMWYSYNDQNPSLQKIGSYRNMINDTDAKTRGVLYMYT